MRALILLGLLLLAAPVSAATKCVDAATGNDANTYAQNNGTSVCWATIGRAAWGSTNRAAPSGAQAAAGGDTVLVASGTYNYTGHVDDRFDGVYNPVNEGSLGSYLTFSCIGTCTLTAAATESPVIGAHSKDYVKWFADTRLGYTWIINACGKLAGCAASGIVWTHPDTGAVVCQDSTGCWIEGITLDGGPETDFSPTDNYTGIRFESCTDCVARNNRITSVESPSAHGYAINLYHTPNALIEHNTVTDSDVCVETKNNPSGTGVTSGIVRFNYCETQDEGFGSSITEADTEAGMLFYQNIINGPSFGFFVTGSTGVTNDDIFNNTFYNVDNVVVWLGLYTNTRFWNNVVLTTSRVVQSDSGTMPADEALDLQHNDTFGFTQYYTGTDGNRTFASFNAAYAGQNDDAPASVTTDPLIVNAATGDFRLCTGSGTPAVGCAGASPALSLGRALNNICATTGQAVQAGAYCSSVTIGVETQAANQGAVRLRRP